jgi:putative transposase
MKRPTATLKAPPTPNLLKRAARIVRFEPGTRWQLESDAVTILRQVSSDRVLIRFGDERTQIVPAAALEPVAIFQEGIDATARAKPLDEHSQVTWERALEERTLIAALVEGRDLGRTAIARVAQALAISERQVRRKIRRYVELNTVDAFLPQRTGPIPGSTRLHPELERLMRDEIHHFLKDSPDAGVDDIHPMLEAAAKALGFRPPGRSTVSRRLRTIRRHPERWPNAIGRELAYRNKPVRGAIQTERPLSVVEMDHTICDVHIIEPRSGEPIGRPWLTLMIDRATRVILGMLLSLEAPSRLSVGLCLHHGVFPKLPWLSSLGIPDACWPGFGLVGTLFTDNAKEFKARSHRRGTQVYGIDLQLRPLGDPAAGGIIERAIGTFMGKIRLLPGASYSKLLKKKPRHADRAARMTLKELELFLARQISVYHQSTHDTLGMPPLTAWERAWTVNGEPCLPCVPDSADHFLLTFLPGEWRVVTREGIELHSLQYQSAALASLIEPRIKRMVRFDPRDLSRVFVESTDAYIPAVLSNYAGPPFSVWEWREIHRRERELGRVRDPDRLAAELRANRALVEKTAKIGRHLRDARRFAREDVWREARTPPSPRDRVLRSAPNPGDAFCRVED